MWWRGCGILLLCVSVRGCVLAGEERAEGNVEVVVEGKDRKRSRRTVLGRACRSRADWRCHSSLDVKYGIV
jgi:hypothetical protein